MIQVSKCFIHTCHIAQRNEGSGYHNLCPALESSDIYTWDGTQCPGEDLGDATYNY